ncbi:hypothetical protein DESUT3_09380 [Desulfuromonas versatilis]|uniref:Transcription elongation factor GreA/GreB C-terminal domain-containing protein n=1 Tax=Desulfuromonas versatilis TaxID=2802975 RepID=A0ABN6DVI2_9BACT|nr:GreA/GreB family elongation factor [Desulfuromonas versatilis]BCR03869.1 hypothetical protein DESUT3_09380 [Desulfuromonas versatilis]
MNKARILQLIIETLAADLAVLFQAAKTAHEAATHEENIPDNKYATLSLEASYIAQAQANRAQEIKAALDAYRGLELKAFAEQAPIRLSALVTLEDADGGTRMVFIGPEAGGLKVKEGGREIVVITPQSPVGRELIGKRLGDEVEMRAGGSVKQYEIVAIC